MTYDRDEKVRALQAVIFASETPCDEERLAAVLDVPVTDVEELAADLAELMEGSALQVVRLAGGFQIATRPRFAGYVQRLREPEPERLSPQAMETLAIIAYLQPITRPEIDEIRGVNSTAAVNSLIDKGVVAIAGRKDAPGRPFLLVTTPHFLSAFGLNDLDELPELTVGETDFREQLGELVAEDGEGEQAAATAAADAESAGPEEEADEAPDASDEPT
ncbi:MAG: SMC-Scp complex subunit ScpB [Armatimonadota bacterium]